MKISRSGLSVLNKGVLQIRGPDTAKFLNGLVTTRLLPNVIKKKQHTISEAENRHANLSKVIDTSQNWGLMHEDIYDPENNILIRRDGLNSMFLNSKGRVINDCFIYPQPFHNFQGEFDDSIKEPKYIVEVEKSFVSQLHILLKMHKLSAKVKIVELDSMFSYYFYNDTPQFDEFLDYIQEKYFQTYTPLDALKRANNFIKDGDVFNPEFSSYIQGFAIDNRIPNFGLKFITNKQIGREGDNLPLYGIFLDKFSKAFSAVEEVDPDVIKRRRFLNGLFETQDAPKGSALLPFETNLDFVNGLSLDKGCYVGQELTIRTFNNGIIRKRVMPVTFFELDESAAESSADPSHNGSTGPTILKLQSLSPTVISSLEVTPLIETSTNSSESETSLTSPFGNSKPVRKRKSTSGKLLSVQDNMGFISINLSDAKNNDLFKLEIPTLDGGVQHLGLKITQPDWWPQD